MALRSTSIQAVFRLKGNLPGTVTIMTKTLVLLLLINSLKNMVEPITLMKMVIRQLVPKKLMERGIILISMVNKLKVDLLLMTVITTKTENKLISGQTAILN